VNQTTWAHGAGVSLDLDVFNLLFTNPAISKKIANFGLFRADLVIRMQVNATNFHYGAIQVYWEPLPTQRVRELSDTIFTVSQRPLQFVLNPSDSKTLEFHVPFVYHRDYIELENYPGTEQIGALKTLTWRNLGTSNAVVSNATITTQAFFENVEMIIPIAQGEDVAQEENGDPKVRVGEVLTKIAETGLDIIRGKEQTEDGLISTFSSATASALGIFRNVPIIGKFAMQGQHFLNKVTDTAHLWGLSRPHQLTSITYVRPSAASRMAHTKGVDTSPILSLDPQCAAPLAGGCFAPDSEDQMALSTIFSRWSAFTSFDWDVADTVDTKLMDIAVYPGVFNVSGTNISPSSVGFASLPFKYWRGSLEYKFVIIKSAYHSGRLRLQFSPTGLGLTAAAQSEVYTQILDITEGSETTIRVNWTQSKKYQDLSVEPDAEVFDPVSIIYNSTAFNGVLNVTVHNELVAPDGASGVTIIAYVRGGPDLDFQVLKQDDSNSPSAITYFAQGEIVELVGELDEEMTDIAAALNFGERTASVRDLIKRYTLHRLFGYTNAVDPAFGMVNYFFGVLPAPPGIQTSGVDIMYNKSGGAVPMNYCYNHLLSFFLPGYLGWRGSIRYKIELQQVSQLGTTNETMYATRGTYFTPAATIDLTSHTSYKSPDDDAYLASPAVKYIPSGLAGMELAKSSVNGTLEYSVPWYNTFNFCVTNTENWTQFTKLLTTPDMHHTVMAERLSGSSSTYRPQNLGVYVAAGEDFNYVWYLGAPVMAKAGFLPP
jgi:hypothetical protein